MKVIKNVCFLEEFLTKKSSAKEKVLWFFILVLIIMFIMGRFL